MTATYFDTQKFDTSTFDTSVRYISNSVIIKWNEVAFIENSCKFLWDERAFIENSCKFLWDERSYTENSCKFLWDERSYTENSCKFLWGGRAFVENNIIIKWNEGPSLPWPLVDYISVITPQGQYLYPEIIGGSISFKSGSVGQANLQLSEFIPEDCRCTFYLNGGVRLFDGISRRAQKDSKGIHTITIDEYEEILKPQDLQGGMVLAKQTWFDVTLANLVSSNKPADNNNIVGILYMASSAIPNYLFVESDVTNHIYKWVYTGITYTITEVYQDATLLTQRANAAALTSNSGWYHDTAANTLYVRCTDNVSPWYHAISVPYIGEQKLISDTASLPVRIGNIQDQSSTVIGYWETAHGDVPMDILDNLLDALKLEKECTIRNGYCYIDIATKIGSGNNGTPANIYSEDNNLISLDSIDIADARYTVNSALLQGYGSGAGSVRSGKHINMGRGWRHAILDDSTIHSQAMADSFVQNYLDRNYLPARTIKATVPLKVGNTIDQRRLGDTVHFSIDSEHIEQDLRVQEISIKLKPLTMALTVGDRLRTFEQQLQAMEKAAESWRKHIEDLTDTYSYTWSSKVDQNVAVSDKFNITSDILKIQKLELTCSTDNYVDDQSPQSAADGSGGEGGGGDPGQSGTEPVTGHNHAIGGNTGTPSATTSVATSGHVHSQGSLVNGIPSGTTDACSSVSATTGCCTAVNCGKQWVSSVSVGATVSLASSGHVHGITGSTGTPSATASVASSGHTHPLPEATGYDAGHYHNLPTVDNPWIDDWIYDVNGNKTPRPELKYLPSGSDPEMYLDIKIDNVSIAGSPFVVLVHDDVGTIPIDTLVTTAGDHTVSLSLSNKTTPGADCRINFSLGISGRIFVDTIIKS